MHFRILTDRRLAATALAIRLFVIDHIGAFPRSLNELVPSYLPAVPMDPMAVGNRPIGYLPRAEHPVIYSVGFNGADDGASEAALRGEFGELCEWQRFDRVFYLSQRPRAFLYVPRPEDTGPIPCWPVDALAPWERHLPLTSDWYPGKDQDLTPR